MTKTALAIEKITTIASRNGIVATSDLQDLNDRVNFTKAMLANVLDPSVFTLASHPASLHSFYVNLPRKRPGYVSKRKLAADLGRVIRENDAFGAASVIHAKITR